VSLAVEADIKRHALTHKHTGLKDRFYARVKAQDSVPASETALREQNAELRRKLDDMRADVTPSGRCHRRCVVTWASVAVSQP
jgi:hypothetical protein